MLEELLIEGKKKSCKHCYDSVRHDNKAIPFKHVCTVNCQIQNWLSNLGICITF